MAATQCCFAFEVGKPGVCSVYPCRGEQHSIEVPETMYNEPFKKIVRELVSAEHCITCHYKT